MPSAQGLSAEFIENSFKEVNIPITLTKFHYFENIISNNCSNGAKIKVKKFKKHKTK